MLWVGLGAVAGTPGEAGDDRLDRAHRHRCIAAAGEQRRLRFLGWRRAAFEKLTEGAPGGRVQRHLTRLETLAAADAHAAGAIAQVMSASRSVATSPTRTPACSMSWTRA
jgi:hypothetical protein